MSPVATPLPEPVAAQLAAVVGRQHLRVGDEILPEYGHDEALSLPPHVPDVVVLPGSTDEVARIVEVARALAVPVTARGSATGLSGGCLPGHGGIVVSFERMDRILSIDTANHAAVVQPGVTLAQLNVALAEHHLTYPVAPGEDSASLGGTVATNAGGMRAVRHGVTRQHVTGLQIVTGTGAVVRLGGMVTKASSGYDLVQLVVGSEGTLALITEVTVRVVGILDHAATVVAPFPTLEGATSVVPTLLESGLQPSIVEYIDQLSMAGVTEHAGIELAIPEKERASALAYLVIVVEQRTRDRLDEDVEELAGLLEAQGATNTYVLAPSAGAGLVRAREQAFWAAKAAGADDIVDVVVPRAAIAPFIESVGALAAAAASLVIGCGHAGDGNVHLSVFQPDPAIRHRLVGDMLTAGKALGGLISGEHGIGVAKKPYFAELEDPVHLDLLAGIKAAFDPAGILNPGTTIDPIDPIDPAGHRDLAGPAHPVDPVHRGGGGIRHPGAQAPAR